MFQKLKQTLELIKFSHTIFALPFALIAYFVATDGTPQWRTLIWVLLCLVLARTAAMTFNRVVDAKIDAENPRTKSRHIPSGLLSKKYVLFLTTISSLGFIASAFQLNTLCGILAPFCLAILFFYSLAKRFTHFTQLWLGLALGLAPIGATLAVLGRPTISSLVLGSAVLFWVAGFDLLYALQDLEFDRKQGLRSLSVKLGIKNSFRIALGLHALFLMGLIGYGLLTPLGWLYWLGVLCAIGFILYEHLSLEDDLKNLHAAFFTANGALSLCLLGFVLADLFLLD